MACLHTRTPNSILCFCAPFSYLPFIKGKNPYEVGRGNIYRKDCFFIFICVGYGEVFGFGVKKSSRYWPESGGECERHPFRCRIPFKNFERFSLLQRHFSNRFVLLAVGRVHVCVEKYIPSHSADSSKIFLNCRHRNGFLKKIRRKNCFCGNESCSKTDWNLVTSWVVYK